MVETFKYNNSSKQCIVLVQFSTDLNEIKKESILILVKVKYMSNITIGAITPGLLATPKPTLRAKIKVP